MNFKTVLLAVMLASGVGAAQGMGKPLLGGTTSGLTWGLYAGGLTTASLQEEGQGLRVSVPVGARVLGTRYDLQERAALLTYRIPRGLDARSALAYATNQLQLQGFDIGVRTFPNASTAQAILSRDSQNMEVRAVRRANGDLQVSYVFLRGAAGP
ncbi:hypothetical protein [Deinococcus arenicola]|uniref:Uncharacterized protein n=1 Tax=Deinococcus arenicola TaxID=2994950 RepID=A0ABU4DV48_9DEIO|nr:hypothetical protein [Deinococcus sp. ZS9-10]MDV6375755.1 hypothetical protein [Deinococcus sp. ZS9-10]